MKNIIENSGNTKYKVGDNVPLLGVIKNTFEYSDGLVQYQIGFMYYAEKCLDEAVLQMTLEKTTASKIISLVLKCIYPSIFGEPTLSNLEFIESYKRWWFNSGGRYFFRNNKDKKTCAISDTVMIETNLSKISIKENVITYISKSIY